jgi:hypothetical protein
MINSTRVGVTRRIVGRTRPLKKASLRAQLGKQQGAQLGGAFLSVA